MSHKREPIKHTCPDIDKYIRCIKNVIVSDRDLLRSSEEELLEAARDMASELENCIGYLEELRKSNSTLREWGIEEAEKFDDLEKQFTSEQAGLVDTVYKLTH